MLTILKIGIHVSMENLTQSFDAQHKTVQIHYLEGVALHHIRCRCKYIYYMLYGIHDPRPRSPCPAPHETTNTVFLPLPLSMLTTNVTKHNNNCKDRRITLTLMSPEVVQVNCSLAMPFSVTESPL